MVLGGDLSSMLNDLLVPGVPIVEKIIRPVVILLFMVLILRVLGQRGLAQMNAFDLVVLLTLSNTVQNAIIGNDNSLVGGMIGATALVLANAAVVHFLYHHRRIDRRIEGEPIPLVRGGRAIEENLHKALITEDELRAAVHRQGVLSVEECEQVILETSGTITVIPRRPTSLEAGTDAIEARLARIEQQLDALVSRGAGSGPAAPSTSGPDPAIP